MEDHQSFDSASILTAKEQGESSELSEVEQKTENIMLLCKSVVHPHPELCVQFLGIVVSNGKGHQVGSV